MKLRTSCYVTPWSHNYIILDLIERKHNKTYRSCRAVNWKSCGVPCDLRVATGSFGQKQRESCTVIDGEQGSLLRYCCSYSLACLAKWRVGDFGFPVMKESTSLKPSSVISIQLLTRTRLRESPSALPLLESTKNNVQTTDRRKTNPTTLRSACTCCFVVAVAERAFTSTRPHPATEREHVGMLFSSTKKRDKPVTNLWD